MIRNKQKRFKVVAAVIGMLQITQTAFADVTVVSGAKIIMTTSTLRNKGDWTVNAGGTFTPGTGTIMMNPASGTKNITTNGSGFYNLTVNGAGGTAVNLPDSDLTVAGRLTVTSGTLNFDNDKNLTLSDAGATGTALSVGAAGTLANTGTGDLTLAAAVANAGAISFNSSDDAGNAIQLRSSVNGTQRNWQGAGTYSMTDVNAKDQTVIGGTPVGINLVSSTNAGNNINFFFGGAMTIQGTAYNGKAEGATLNGKAIRMVHYDGSVTSTYTATTDGSGVFSVAGVSMASGDTIVIYLNDEAQEGNLVYVSNGASVTDLKLYQDAVSIRTDATTATNAKLAAADDGDDDIKYNVAAGAATFENNFELYVFSGSTYAPAGSVSAQNVDLNGTLTLAANALNVSGTFDATGGAFTTAGVTMFSAGAGSVNIFSDGDSFYDVVINDGGGGATFVLEDTLDVNHDLTITQGTLDVKAAENNAITIAGNWSNAGTFVERTGTVTFDGGAAQTINAGGIGNAAKDFNNLTVSGSTLQLVTSALQVNGTLTIAASKSLDLNAQNLTLATLSNPGTLQLEGGETVTITTFDSAQGTVLYDGVTSVTIPSFTTAYYNLTFDEVGAANPTYTLPDANLTVNGVLSVADGTLAFDNDKSLTVNDNGTTGTAIAVAAAGILANTGTGDLTLNADVSNAGGITFNSSDDAGNGITIASSGGAVQRNWQGAGTFSMTDVNASYQRCVGGTPGFIFVSSGTDGLNNTNWLFGGGTLAATDVEPASLAAGAESDVLVAFTLVNLLPIDGKVVLDFPSGFNATGLAAVTNVANVDGGWTIALSNGDGTNDVVTLTRNGAGTVINGGTAVQIRLEDEIRNPQIAGSAGTYSLQTQLNAGSTLDSATVAADVITAGALSSTNVEPASLLLSATGNVTIDFTTTNPIPLDGKIVVTFPTSLGGGFAFDQGGATAVTSSAGFDGTLTAAVAANVVTITRAAGTAASAGAKQIVLSNIMNPGAAGSTGTYQILTTTAGSISIDQDTAVAADAIGTAASGSVPLLLNSLGAATGTYTLGSTTTGEIYLRVTDTDENTNIATLQTITATVRSSQTGDSESVTLTETGVATGIFQSAAGGLLYDADDPAAANNGVLETRNGDTITLNYIDDDDAADNTSVSATVQAGEEQILVSMTAAPSSVRIGDPVVFTAKIQNETFETLSGFKLVAQLPTGLSYREGSASLSGGTFESVGGSSTVEFLNISDIAAGANAVLTFQTIVGTQAQPGEFPVTLYAQVNPIISNTAQVTLSIRPDPIFTMGTLIGKVFWDINRNGVQDPGEDGIPNAVLATEEGYVMTTDEFGRYSLPDFRPGRHMVKIDRNSMPVGTQLTTAEAIVVNQTDAMLAKANFGVLIPESSAHLYDQERDEDVILTLQKDTAAPKKFFSLEFHRVQKSPTSSLLEESVGPSTLTLDADPEIRLPFRINMNYAQFVREWKFEVVRIEEDPNKIFDKADAANLKTVALAEETGAPTTSAFAYPWTHPFTDAAGDAIEYGVRVTLTDKNEKQDQILYRITPSRAGEGIQWTLERLDAREAISVNGTSVTVQGQTHPRILVSLYGREMLTAADGKFTYQVILPEGGHEVPVYLYLNDRQEPVKVIRSIDLRDTYLFFVGFSEYEYGSLDIKGNILSVTEEDKARFNEKWYDEGRLAYYLKGKIKGKYLITASVDTTREKRELYRNLEPEDYYPVYGDASTVQADASDTQDRYFLLLEVDKSYFKYGNFETGFTGTEFADFSRTLHGAKAHYQSLANGPEETPRTVATLFTTKARQKAAHAEFRATGGSLYYLRHKDVIQGSEKLKLVIRDEVSGIALSETPLVQGVDYSIDYDEARIRLHRPLSIVSSTGSSILSANPLAGNPQFMSIDYEYRVRAEVDAATQGARVSHFVLGDNLRLGGTHVEEDRSMERYNLTGVDGTLYLPLETTVRAEGADSTLQAAGSYVSTDGGLTFDEVRQGVDESSGPSAARKFELSSSPWEGLKVQSYYRYLEANFSSSATLSEAGMERYGIGGAQDLGAAGSLTGTYQEQRVLEGATPLTLTEPRVNSTSINLVHQMAVGDFDFTEEFRRTQDSAETVDLVGAEVGYRLDATARVAVSGQADMGQAGYSQMRMSAEKAIGDNLKLMAVQSFGDLGPGSQVGLTTGPAGSTADQKLIKSFGSMRVPDPAPGTNPAEDPNKDKEKRPALALGAKRSISKDTDIEIGSVMGEEADQKKTFKLSRVTPDGRVLEMVQESSATSDTSSYTEETPVGNGGSKYTQTSTTTDRLSGQQLSTRVEGTRIFFPESRGSLYQEDSTSESTSDGAQTTGKLVGGSYAVNKNTTLDFNYEKQREILAGELRDHQVARFGAEYFDFNRLAYRNDWEFQDLGDAIKTQQLISAGRVAWKPTEDWSIVSRYEWSWAKSKETMKERTRFTELQSGLAYRPVENDRLNLLAEYKYLTDETPTIVDPTLPANVTANQIDLNNEVYSARQVLRGEFAYDILPQVTWIEKLAYRGQDVLGAANGSERENSRTYLSAHRLTWHVTDRMDLAGEGRFLGQSLAEDMSLSFLGEASYRFFDSLRLSVGYSGTQYESAAARDLNVEVKGVYFRIFYDALQDAQNLLAKKKENAEVVAKKIEKEISDVGQINGRERDIQEMRSRLAYAKVLMERGLYDEAIEALNQGLELQVRAKKYADRAQATQKRLDFYKRQGKLFLQHGMFERAFREFEKAYKVNAFDQELLELMSKSRSELQRLRRLKREIWRKKTSEFRKLESIADADAALRGAIQIHYRYGMEYLEAGMYDEAIAEWSLGMDLLKNVGAGPDAASERRKKLVEELEAINQKAKDYLSAGDPDQAAQELRRGAGLIRDL